MFALNFYPELYDDLLLNSRKTATIRLGDKSDKYESGMVVWITVGSRYSRRQKLFSAIIDRVDVKPIGELSPRDIERENPLYLPQSKVYNACFAFGPLIVTPDEIADPYALMLTCRVTRGDREIFAGEASTAQLKRRFEEIVFWLLRSNAILTGTVLSTGTGIIQPLGAGLEVGDVVTLSCPELGELQNPVALV